MFSIRMIKSLHKPLIKYFNNNADNNNTVG